MIESERRAIAGPIGTKAAEHYFQTRTAHGESIEVLGKHLGVPNPDRFFLQCGEFIGFRWEHGKDLPPGWRWNKKLDPFAIVPRMNTNAAREARANQPEVLPAPCIWKSLEASGVDLSVLDQITRKMRSPGLEKVSGTWIYSLSQNGAAFIQDIEFSIIPGATEITSAEYWKLKEQEDDATDALIAQNKDPWTKGAPTEVGLYWVETNVPSDKPHLLMVEKGTHCAAQSPDYCLYPQRNGLISGDPILLDAKEILRHVSINPPSL